jgi:prevent-host-death family protein
MLEAKVSIGRVKRDISELVNRVAYGGERIILTSRGKPKAVIVSLDDLNRLKYDESIARTGAELPETLEELVERIKATPPNPAMIEPARGSLADSLAHLIATSAGSEFNQEEWEEQWAKVEAEMKEIERLNDLAELQFWQ